MNLRSLLLLGLLMLPLPASGQIGDCADCRLGLYDEPALLNNFGDITPFVPKNIYLGMKFAAPETGLTLVEFSVSGLESGSNLLVLSVFSVTTPPANILFGSIAAPTDTSATSTQIGGMDVAWPQCIAGSQALLQIQLLATAPVNNHLLRVMHKFPTSNPLYNRHPVLTRCDVPFFTAVRINGADYILGGVVAVEGRTWSGMKGLYR